MSASSSSSGQPEPGRPLVIRLVGDIMLGDSPQVFGRGVGSRLRAMGSRRATERLRDVLPRADLTVGNLEVVCASTSGAAGFEQRIYRGAPETLELLPAWGIDAVSACTNHMMQHGQVAFEECMTGLRRVGVTAIGVDGTTQPAVFELRRTKIGILAFNFRPVQYQLAPPPWPEPTEDSVREAVRAARASHDVLFVSLHWGDEFMPLPSREQVSFARSLVDAGADVVYGHHPHIVQGVESYRRGVIAYSLGNFIYDQWQPRLRRTMALRIECDSGGVIGWGIEPARIADDHFPALVANRTAEMEHHQYLARQIDSLGPADYARALELENRRFRREIAAHYLASFWRFNPVDLAGNVRAIIARRLKSMR